MSASVLPMTFRLPGPAARLLTNFLAAGDNADANGCNARLDTAGVGGSVRKQQISAGNRRVALTPLGSREAA